MRMIDSHEYAVRYYVGNVVHRVFYANGRAAHLAASEAAHVRRDWTADTRTVEVIHVSPRTGTYTDGETVVAIYDGAQRPVT